MKKNTTTVIASETKQSIVKHRPMVDCRASLAMTATLFLSLIQPTQAQDFPNKNITMIVPFAAGGSSDVIARLFAEEMSKDLKATIVIENIGGAGGTAGLFRGAKAEADGYTVIAGNSGTNAASFHIYKDLKYTPESFAAIGMMAKTSPLIAVKNDLPVKSVAEFITLAKAKPGELTLGHAGVGSNNFLICKAFLAATKIDVKLIGYRGAAPALNDLMGGHVDGVCDSASSVAPAIQGNKAKGLVVGSTERITSLPNVPHSVEQGIPTFQLQGWNGLFVPAGTPAPVVKRLNDSLLKALASPALQKRMVDIEVQAPSTAELTPSFLEARVKDDLAKYKVLLEEVK